MDTVIVYGTNYGTSLKVAQILGEQIAGAVELVDIKDINNIDLDSINKLIIGCSIKFGKIPNEMKVWLEEKKEKFKNKEIFIYMCAGEKNEVKLERLFKANIPESILEEAKYITCVGGELYLDKFNFLIRVIFRIIKKINPSLDSLSFEKIEKLAQTINEQEVDNK